MKPAEVLGTRPIASAALTATTALLDAIGPYQVRTTKSQVAFRRRRGFAYLWRPDRYLPNPGAEVVLSIALPSPDPSPRWKEVVQAAPRIWMHHLDLRDPASEVDEEVATWLRAAWVAAA